MYKNKSSKFNKSVSNLEKNTEKRILSFKEIKLQMNITIMSVCAIVLIILGSSYAAFIWTNTSTVSHTIAAGDYSITIADSSPSTNGTINLSSTYPMSDTDGLATTAYEFTITNNSKTTIGYSLKLNDDTATINSDGCSSNLIDRKYIKINMTGNKEIATSLLSNLSNNELDFGTLESGKSKTYSLRLWIISNAPNTVISQHFHGKLELETNQITTRDIALSNAIKEDNPNITYSTPDFTKIEENNIGLVHDKDKDGSTYYYRGNIENNYVQFATYKSDITIEYRNRSPITVAKSGQPIVWRIVRINGDGTIRLIMDNSIGLFKFNDDTNEEQNLGYTYSGTDSIIKQNLENWYNSNLSDYSDSYIATSYFCNDTTDTRDSTNITYNATTRLNNGNPTFLCPTTDKPYGGEYKLKIGLITADEVVYAGGFPWEQNNNFYLSNLSAINYDGIFTMTPSLYYFDNEHHFLYGFYKTLYEDYYVYDELNTNPVINLVSDVKIKSGTGTKSDPYVINTDS